MARESRQTLFGFETPEDVRARIGRTGQEQDMAAAMMPAGRGMVRNAAAAGRSLGGAIQEKLFGPNPEVAKAEQIQQIMQARQVDSKDPVSYFGGVAEDLYKAGHINEAMQAIQKRQEFMESQSNIDYKAEAVKPDIWRQIEAAIPSMPAKAQALMREWIDSQMAKNLAIGSGSKDPSLKNMTTNDIAAASSHLATSYEDIWGELSDEGKQAFAADVANRAKYYRDTHGLSEDRARSAAAAELAKNVKERELPWYQPRLGSNNYEYKSGGVVEKPTGANEVKRKTKDGRTAVFDGETKEFLRYED